MGIGTTLIALGLMLSVFGLYYAKMPLVASIGVCLEIAGVFLVIRDRIRNNEHKKLIAPAIGAVVIVSMAIFYRFFYL